MKKPLVAIVGKPNVGKSTFFNKVAGKKISIVEDLPGVTRDRIYADTEWSGIKFSIVDTGGLDFSKNDEVYTNILKQARLAVDLADVIVFFVDGKEGLTSTDRDVAEFLRKTKKKIILAVNKLDNNEIEKTYEFYELNLGHPILLSVEQSIGTADLLDEVVANLKKIEIDEDTDSLKIAIVGKPNAGKSSLTNCLLGEERVVVSPVAGTTRDAIDTPFKYNGKNYTLIDTAGLRRKSRIEPSSIEKYSAVRSIDAISRCDVAVLMIDASVGITEQDTKIAGLIIEENKPNIIVINKWDLIEKNNKTMNEFKKKLETDFAFMKYFVPLFISCETKQRIGEVMKMVEYVYENANRNISMGLFNNALNNAIALSTPPIVKNKRLKILYGKQSGVCPPTFDIYCNDASIVDNSYARYIENSLRNAFDFKGTPIKLNFKNKFDE